MVFFPDGTRAARTVTLDDGAFRVSLQPGRYRIRIENTGHRTKDFELDILGEDVDLGKIELAVGEEIEAASIEAASLIYRRGTRVVYDVSKDPDAGKISMTEMASRIPELKMTAKNGRLEYEQQPFKSILINNEENGMINAARQYPMEFIKADCMKTIEIVMPGDSEYNNDQPIMLITLARSLPYGFASNLMLQSDTKNNHAPTADAVINTPVIGVGAGYRFQYAGAPALTNEILRETADGTRTESYTTSQEWSDSHNIKTNLFKTFANETVQINASLNASVSDARSYKESGTSGFGETVTKSHSHSPFRLGGGLRIRGSFGPSITRIAKKYQWSLAYTYRNTQQDVKTEYLGLGPQASSNGMEEHRAQATLELRNLSFKPFTASLSAKGGYYNRSYNSLTSGIGDTQGLDYAQQVGFLDIAALGSAFERKLGFTFLLNSEYLVNHGSFVNGNSVSPLDYNDFNVNPTLGLTWHFKRSSLGASWTRMVKRPGISQLNPYEDRSNPFNIKTGNPALKGAVTDSYSLSYMLRPSLSWIRDASLRVSYANTTNSITRITTLSDNGVAISSYCNLGKQESLGANSMINLTPFKQFMITLNGTYSWNTVTLPTGQLNSYHSLVASSGFTWTPEWFELSGTFHLAPSLASVQTSKLILEPYGEISIARYFRKPHIGVSFTASDVFHTGGRKESIIKGPDFIQYNYNERLGCSFIFRVYWRFGRFKPTETVEIKAYDM